MTRLILYFSLLCFPVLAFGQENSVKIAIIKADDVRGKTSKWNRFFAISAEKEVKVSAGIICDSLSGGDKAYFDWLRALHSSGQVEFWNHGWDHKSWTDETGARISEFSGSGYEHQKKHFEDAQAIMKRVLGSAPIAFGTPYNALDDDTINVMNENAEMRLFFCYQAKGLKDKVLVPMKLRGEPDGPGRPNFERFKEEYFTRKEVSLSALQFHPNAFEEEHFKEYSKILDFMISEGWTFLLPTAYVAMADLAGRADQSSGGDVQKAASQE